MIRLLISLFLLATSPALANANWDYGAGMIGDEGWGVLSPDFAACEIGGKQSPINIENTLPSDLPALRLDYRSTDAKIALREHTVIVTLKPRNTLQIDTQRYTLTQMRFHSPSEHQIKGRNAPLEIHLIHRDQHEGLLIMVVLVQLGSENPAIATLLEAATKKPYDVTLDMRALHPSALGYYAYEGSMSWPPCTEGVQWRILKNPITLSTQQLRALVRVIGRNARLIQPLNGRVVKESND
jgi:carbonic anhydrase